MKMTLATGSFAVHFILISIALAPSPTHVGASIGLPVLSVELLAETISRGTLPSGVTTIRLAAPIAVTPENILWPIPATAPESETAYLPSSILERHPTPVSEPDITTLHELKTSGLPVRLRIYVDRFGKVAEVAVFDVGPLDGEFANGLRLMFLATAFLPGRQGGVDVPAYLDIQLSGQ